MARWRARSTVKPARKPVSWSPEPRLAQPGSCCPLPRVRPRSVQKCTVRGRHQGRSAYEVVPRGAQRSLQGRPSAAASSPTRGDGLDEALTGLAYQRVLALANRVQSADTTLVGVDVLATFDVEGLSVTSQNGHFSSDSLPVWPTSAGITAVSRPILYD